MQIWIGLQDTQQLEIANASVDKVGMRNVRGPLPTFLCEFFS